MDKFAGGQNKLVDWKQQLSKPVAPSRRNFVPLRSWPFCAHERQAEMDAYRNLPSAFK